MKQIPLTKGKFALVDDDDFEYLNQWKWHFDGRYAARRVYLTKGSKNRKFKTFYMQKEVMKTEIMVDHIDRDGLNNLKKNLRTCTHRQNMLNRGSDKGSTSKYKGVCWHKKAKKWSAQIHILGEKKHLGLFESEETAAKIYNEFAAFHFKEFACLNPI